MEKMLKFPRTPHLEKSNIQHGDADLKQIPFSQIKDKYIVIEEKVDGANCGISFSADGKLLLQSRGHYLTGGARERHFDRFKVWASQNKCAFYGVLGSRYVLYGEWLFAKHKVFYDILPDYFLEFDVFDKQNGCFLSTEARQTLLKSLPQIKSVPVLASGRFSSLEQVLAYLTNSCYISDQHLANLKKSCDMVGEDYQKILAETDQTQAMEGLYIKVEQGGQVLDRVKFVRANYFQPVDDGSWFKRKIICNQTK